MLDNSPKKTPLGDKFNNVDFPIEPNAWSEMATLLPKGKPKGPLSIFGKMGFFIALIPLFFIVFWQLSSEFSRAQKTSLAVAETTFLQDKKEERNVKNPIELNKLNLKETTSQSSLIGGKTALNPSSTNDKTPSELSLINDKTTLELNKTALKNKDLKSNSTNGKTGLINNKNVSANAQSSITDNKKALVFNKTALKDKDLKLNLTNNKLNLIGSKNALMNAQLSTNSIDNKSFLAINKSVLSNENLISNELSNKNGQTLNQPVLSVNNASNNASSRDKKGESTIDFNAKSNADFVIKNALDSSNASFNKKSLNALITSNSDNVKKELVNFKSVDNQLITPTSKGRIAAELAFLERRELNSIYSETPQNINDLKQINAFLPTTLIPISQLWRGKHHQISVGLGHASLEFNNHNRPAINRFRLAYNYRVTPLLGIGTSTNYVLINPQGYYSTTELELNLYFVSRVRFDAFLSAGYGYRQWDFQNNASETLTGRGRGFTLGLNAQYAITPKYTMGFRIDLKQVAEPDFGFLLVFSRCF